MLTNQNRCAGVALMLRRFTRPSSGDDTLTTGIFSTLSTNAWSIGAADSAND